MDFKENTEIREKISDLESCEIMQADPITKIIDCSYEQTNSTLLFSCALSSGKAVLVIFRACAPGIFRICIGFEDIQSTHMSSLFSRTQWEPVETEFCEDEEDYYFKSSGYNVVFSKSGWKYKIINADGRTIFETMNADKNCMGEYESAPLGYCSLYSRPEIFSCECVRLCPDEDIYGFGERFEEVSKRGKVEVTLVSAPLGTVPKICYKPVPFYYSTKGYGLFLNSSEISTFDVGVRSYQSVSIVCPGGEIDYYVFAAPTPADALRCYCEVTGYPTVPPIWALGYNQASAEVWHENGKNYFGYKDQEKVLKVARELRRRGIPCDSITLDVGWCTDLTVSDYDYQFGGSFPDPVGMIKELKDLGFHLLVWQWPYMKEHYSNFKEAVERGFLVKDSNGQPFMVHKDGMYCIDFSNPEAAAWVAEKNRKLLDLGVEGFMTDFAELAPVKGKYYDGMSGGAAHNIYPLRYQRTVYEAGMDRNGECVLWARSGFTSMQRTPGHWAGDNASTFESMGAVIRAGINAGLSGIQFWGHDIAGWFGEKILGKTKWMPPSKELFIRWSQFAFFSPMLRSHGTSAREPWQFGEEAEKIFKKYALLRSSLVSYIKLLAEETGRTGMPIIRAMILEFPDDIACRRLDQQYMFGRDFLVAPVCNVDGYVQFYLPVGKWKNFWTGEIKNGPLSVSLKMPLDKMPLYVRESSEFFDVTDELVRKIESH